MNKISRKTEHEAIAQDGRWLKFKSKYKPSEMVQLLVEIEESEPFERDEISEILV